ncbi:septum formation initiator family protein [Desulfovibrio aminophilus]|nr:septum formation initiator family protein [Desulfovibrio aminophilus]MCM0755809.1 septum formation initiator family protein [Desulfovibrio aminophilus]
MLARRFLVGFLILLNLFLFFRLIWSDQGLFAYMTLRNRYEQLQAQIDEADRKNLDLSQDIRRLKSDRSYQEKVIRERLKYVKDNEILYLLPGESDKPLGDGADDKKD